MRKNLAVVAMAAMAASGLTAVTSAAPAAAAPSGSIVFVRGGNVWLVRADGSGLHQVTRDGTPTHPYLSPSMSDAGVIAAGKGSDVVRMRQNGVVLNRIDPPAMLNSVNQPVDGPPVHVAISPDGSRIAYTMVSYTCPVAADCLGRAVTGVTAATEPTGPSMTSYEHHPSWVSNDRLMVHGGYGSQVKLQDATGPGQHWFDDSDVYGDYDSTDLGDASLSRDGTRLVAIRGYGSSTQMIWYDVLGDPRSAAVSTLPDPAPQCIGAPGDTATDPRLHEPSWAPDGGGFAVGGTGGVWVVAHARGSDCGSMQATLIGPGSSPSWSPAAINPPPLPDVTDEPEARFELEERPSFKGRARVGRRLRATAGSWSPTPEKVRYQWLRNGNRISKATRRTYVVKRKDRRRRISVRVTVRKPGLPAARAVSRARRVR